MVHFVEKAARFRYERVMYSVYCPLIIEEEDGSCFVTVHTPHTTRTSSEQRHAVIGALRSSNNRLSYCSALIDHLKRLL